MRSSRGRYTAQVKGQGKPMARSVFTGEVDPSTWKLPRGTVVFEKAFARNLDFRKAVIDNYGASDSTFEACDFSGAKFAGGVLGHIPLVTYRGCHFSGADLRRVSPLFGKFEGCDFDQARLDDWDARCAEFVGCHFTGRLLRVKFSAQPDDLCLEKLGAYRSTNLFTDNDFRNAELSDCTFGGGIRIGDNQWPPGDDYLVLDRLPERVGRARAEVEKWSPGPERDRGLARLEIYSTGPYKAQRDLVARRSELGRLATALERAGS
jgi:uncharacterized protein YjbI with pentapeptide repeats